MSAWPTDPPSDDPQGADGSLGSGTADTGNIDSGSAGAGSDRYMVVARRYRPQDFTQLVGQAQVSQALGNAINTGRVGHAYLFTGARGVGKTSTARIFSKALNCVNGPTTQPCGVCDICRGVASGDDVDVIEIDGASNRGIDEIRQLRSGVNIRPSRARFKIYIIDEVHMLTTPAFNALLKTLEEPPEHVKFIFCTTEADKIPITVLSRCQRFDFAPLPSQAILDRLAAIAKNEHVEAEPEALAILARRAAGSMRDSQSLLEQLLSYGGKQITVDDVHRALGTAKSSRIATLMAAVATRDAAGALREIDAAAGEGVDLGQLAEQLLGYLRDAMVLSVGASSDMLLHVALSDEPAVRTLATNWGTETLLAAVQIVDQSLTRLRQSTHGRTLVEVAVVRLCSLGQLDMLADLVAQLKSGAPLPAIPAGTAATPRAALPPANPSAAAPSGPPAQKKTAELAPPPPPLAPPAPVAAVSRPTPPVAPPVTRAAEAPRAAEPIRPAPPPRATAAPPTPARSSSYVDDGEIYEGPSASDLAELATISGSRTSVTPAPVETVRPAPSRLEDASDLWQQVLSTVPEMLAEFASKATQTAISAPDRLVVRFPKAYTQAKEYCDRPEKRRDLERAIDQAAGRKLRLELELTADSVVAGPIPSAPQQPRMSRRQRMIDVHRKPIIRQAIEIFGAEVIGVTEPPEQPESDEAAAEPTIAAAVDPAESDV